MPSLIIPLRKSVFAFKNFLETLCGHSFLPKTAPNGFVDFEKDRAYQIEIVVEDYNRNKTYISFYVEGKEDFPDDHITAMKNPIETDKDYLFAFDRHEVYIPKNTFYQTIDLVIEEKKDTLIIEEIPFPQRKGFELNVVIPKDLDSIQRQQLSLAIYDPKEEKVEKQLSYVWTTKKDSILQTKYAHAGQYVLTKDSLAPTIKPLNFKDQRWMSL